MITRLKPEDKANIERVISEMEANVKAKKWSPTSVTYWAGVVLKDGSSYHATNTACHAELSYKKVPDLKYVVSRMQWAEHPEGEKAEAITAYLSWLVSKSPYAKCFTYLKTGKEAFERGFVVAKTANVPCNLMVGGLIAARQATEHYSIVKTWHRLVQLGIHPDIAYCHAHSMMWNSYGVNIENGFSGHTSWYSTNSKEAVLNFKHRRAQIVLASFNSKKIKNHYSREYSPQAGSWGPQTEGGPVLKNLLEKAKKVALGLREKKNNPFNTEGMQKEYVDADKFFPAWVELLKKEYGNENE